MESAFSAGITAANLDSKELQGVSLRFLSDLASKVPPDHSTSKVVSDFIAPRCGGQPFVTLLSPKYVGPAQHYVIHAWSCCFVSDLVLPLLQHFIGDTNTDPAVQAAAISNTFVWIDCFSCALPPCPQPTPVEDAAIKDRGIGKNDGAEGDSSADSAPAAAAAATADLGLNAGAGAANLVGLVAGLASRLAVVDAVLRQCRSALLLLDRHARSLGRTWCLYELGRVAELLGDGSSASNGGGGCGDACEGSPSCASLGICSSRHELGKGSSAGSLRGDASQGSLRGGAPGSSGGGCPSSSSAGCLSASPFHLHVPVFEFPLDVVYGAVQNITLPASQAFSPEDRRGLLAAIAKQFAGQDAGEDNGYDGTAGPEAAGAELEGGDVVVRRSRSGSGGVSVGVAVPLQTASSDPPSEALGTAAKRICLGIQEALTSEVRQLARAGVRSGPRYLACLRKAAEALRLGGAPQAASEKMALAAVKEHRRALGDGDAATLHTLANLALLRRSQGAKQEAEQLLREVLEGRRSTLGRDHPDTAAAANQLAGLLQEEGGGKLEEAAELYGEALDIAIRTLGEDHPDSASACSNLAGVMSSLGRLEEAESLLRRSLEATIRTLGSLHAHTATGYHNLGLLHRSKGEVTSARQYFEEAYDIWLEVLGGEHEDTVMARANLVLALQAEGRSQEAEQLLCGGGMAPRRGPPSDPELSRSKKQEAEGAANEGHAPGVATACAAAGTSISAVSTSAATVAEPPIESCDLREVHGSPAQSAAGGSGTILTTTTNNNTASPGAAAARASGAMAAGGPLVESRDLAQGRGQQQTASDEATGGRGTVQVAVVPTDADMEAAVVRIQAYHRAHMARRRVAEMRRALAAEAGAGAASTVPVSELVASDTPADSTSSASNRAAVEVAAATTIQAYHRGHQARKRVADMKRKAVVGPSSSRISRDRPSRASAAAAAVEAAPPSQPRSPPQPPALRQPSPGTVAVTGEPPSPLPSPRPPSPPASPPAAPAEVQPAPASSLPPPAPGTAAATREQPSLRPSPPASPPAAPAGVAPVEAAMAGLAAAAAALPSLQLQQLLPSPRPQSSYTHHPHSGITPPPPAAPLSARRPLSRNVDIVRAREFQMRCGGIVGGGSDGGTTYRSTGGGAASPFVSPRRSHIPCQGGASAGSTATPAGPTLPPHLPVHHLLHHHSRPDTSPRGGGDGQPSDCASWSALGCDSLSSSSFMTLSPRLPPWMDTLAAAVPRADDLVELHADMLGSALSQLRLMRARDNVTRSGTETCAALQLKLDYIRLAVEQALSTVAGTEPELVNMAPHPLVVPGGGPPPPPPLPLVSPQPPVPRPSTSSSGGGCGGGADRAAVVIGGDGGGGQEQGVLPPVNTGHTSPGSRPGSAGIAAAATGLLPHCPGLREGLRTGAGTAGVAAEGALHRRSSASGGGAGGLAGRCGGVGSGGSAGPGGARSRLGLLPSGGGVALERVRPESSSRGLDLPRAATVVPAAAAAVAPAVHEGDVGALTSELSDLRMLLLTTNSALSAAHRGLHLERATRQALSSEVAELKSKLSAAMTPGRLPGSRPASSRPETASSISLHPSTPEPGPYASARAASSSTAASASGNGSNSSGCSDRPGSSQGRSSITAATAVAAGSGRPGNSRGSLAVGTAGGNGSDRPGSSSSSSRLMGHLTQLSPLGVSDSGGGGGGGGGSGGRLSGRPRSGLLQQQGLPQQVQQQQQQQSSP